MNSDDKYSDEKLHLFIDDELDSTDRAEIMEALGKDDELSYRVCGLLTLKDSVRLAYSDPPVRGRSCKIRCSGFRSGLWQNAVAAMLLLAIGEAGAKNAALLAAEILALSDPDLAGRLKAWRQSQTDRIAEVPSENE